MILSLLAEFKAYWPQRRAYLFEFKLPGMSGNNTYLIHRDDRIEKAPSGQRPDGSAGTRPELALNPIPEEQRAREQRKRRWSKKRSRPDRTARLGGCKPWNWRLIGA